MHDEPGIPELEQLYYDKYDYNTGTFSEMTKKTRKEIYERDLAIFYEAYTGTKLDETNKHTVKSFKDIPLHAYHTIDSCKQDGPYRKRYSSTKNAPLFKLYADHIKNMMKKSNSHNNKLIEIIQSLFVPSKVDKNKLIINPKLTEKMLEKKINDAQGPQG